MTKTSSSLRSFPKRCAALLLPLVFPLLAQAQQVTNPLGNVTLSQLISRILSALMIIGVPVAVLLVVFTGFQFVMAQGNEAKLTTARRNFMYTIVGITIFFGASVLIGAVTSTLTALGVQGLQ